MSDDFKRDDHIFYHYAPRLITLALALGVYLLTLAPDLTWANYGGDGGDLITAAVTLGVPHPPGYPTYVLLGHLIHHLPLGSIAARFHLLSALTTAGAVALFTATTLHRPPATDRPSQSGRAATSPIPDRRLPSIAAALTIAFSPLVWSQATIAEVYGLNLLVVAAVVWAVETERPSWFSGALWGLSLTTHLTSLLLLPYLALRLPRRRWPAFLGGVPLGLLPLLALPWLAAGDSPVVWGDPKTLRGWWWLVSGHIYHDNALALLPAAWPERLSAWGSSLLGQWWFVAWVLVVRSLATRNHQRRHLALGGTAVAYLLYAFTYRAPDAIVLILPALLLLGSPLADLLARLRGAALLLPLALLLIHFPSQRLTIANGVSRGAVRREAVAALTAAPPRAIVLTPGNETIFALWYAHHVLGHRPDLVLVDANLFAFAWYRERLEEQYPTLRALEKDDLVTFRHENRKKRPIYQVDLKERMSRGQRSENRGWRLETGDW